MVVQLMSPSAELVGDLMIEAGMGWVICIILGGELIGEGCGSCCGNGLDVVPAAGDVVAVTTQGRRGEVRKVEAGGGTAQAEGGHVEGAGGLQGSVKGA